MVIREEVGNDLMISSQDEECGQTLDPKERTEGPTALHVRKGHREPWHGLVVFLEGRLVSIA